MKGPSEKGELFAVLEYMKGGQVVTHPCAPSPPPFKESSSSSNPRPLPPSQAQCRRLAPLLKGFQAEHLWAFHASLLVGTWV